jgi:predicted porin
MNKFALSAMAIATITLIQPAFADEISDLKAEIAAQKAADAQRRADEAAQKARLDALEQRLNAVQSSQPAATSAPASTGKAARPGLAYEGDGYGVRLYGLIDATIGQINHTGKDQHKTGFDATPSNAPWFSGARWGLEGHRMFKDEGVDIIFKLEDEYLLKDGSADDDTAAFGRDAWIGFQNDTIGKLTFGRQNTVSRDFSGNYGDPYFNASVGMDEGGWTNSNNFKQMIYYAGSATGTRYNSGIVWKKAFGSFVAGAGYQFGETTGNVSSGSTGSIAAAYNGGPFNISGFFTAANVNGFSHKSYSIGGNYTAGIVRLNTGYFHYIGDQGALGRRTDNAYTLSMKVQPAGKMDYELGVQQMRANNAALNGSGNVYNAYSDASGGSGTISEGKRSTVYGSVFYHFDKSTEAYFVADYLKLAGGWTQSSVTHGLDNQAEYGVGLRFRF